MTEPLVSASSFSTDDETTPLFANSNNSNSNNDLSESKTKTKRKRPRKNKRWQSSSENDDDHDENKISTTPASNSTPFFPGDWDIRQVAVSTSAPDNGPKYQRATVSTMRVREYRSLPRRIYLLLTEPTSSVCASWIFGFIMVAILLMNGLMILQTMSIFQYTPDDCLFCGGTTKVNYLFDEEQPSASTATDHDDCICAPTPYPWTDITLQYLVYFFSIEWILRVLCYSPAPQDRAPTALGRVGQFINYVFSWPMILDFWATFPYYMEFTNFDTNGLMSLRLLRLFRVFQLVRLGSYNVTFTSLIAVLQSSLLHLKILFLILAFGAALFGSLLFWLEKGTWQWYDGEYQFVRESATGDLEPTPFTSIPATFYWFLVTATTVGYGDIVPTTVAGRYVAICAMILSLLVIAFPVSVFSDLWSKELERVGALKSLDTLISESHFDDDDDEWEEDAGGNSKDTTPSPNKEKPNPPTIAGEALPVKQEDTSEQPQQLGIPATLNPFSAHRVNPVTGSATRSWNYGYQHAPHVVAQASSFDGTSEDDTIVVLHKSDLAEILRHTQQISQSQAQIRTILKKYKLLKPSDTNDFGQP